jgi:hypothetical protein
MIAGAVVAVDLAGLIDGPPRVFVACLTLTLILPVVLPVVLLFVSVARKIGINSLFR